MTTYCITAANHGNINNHCASEFQVWEKSQNIRYSAWEWKCLGKKSITEVVNLLETKQENTVVLGELKDKKPDKYTAFNIVDFDNIDTDTATVEIELRVSHNNGKYSIGKMSGF